MLLNFLKQILIFSPDFLEGEAEYDPDCPVSMYKYPGKHTYLAISQKNVI